MSTTPLLGPAPITVGESIFDPKPGKCFACTPPYKHDRVWIPDTTERTLVLCFDGTGDSFDHDNSNVVQFLAMLKKDDPAKQLVYYQAGIGTYTSNVLKTPIIEAMSKLLDQMIAYELPEHIKDGYMFLMQNYRAGDQICIFGFSRGAFTARALAGMLQKVGLLPSSNLEQLPFAYAMYARDDPEGRRLSTQFKRTFSIDVRIKFLGVWDTVESVGLFPRHLPFSGSNNAILYFRHALALDEHRVKFMPSFCTSGIPDDEKPDSKVPEHYEAISKNRNKPMRRQTHGGSSDYEHGVNSTTGPPTNVEEVFFAGAHCDVGGGSVKNGKRNSLARVPLRWMIRECFKTGTGIVFDEHMLKYEVGLDINSVFGASELLELELQAGTSCLGAPDSDELEGFSFRRVPVTVVSALASPFCWIWGALSDLRLHNTSQVTDPPKQSSTTSPLLWIWNKLLHKPAKTDKPAKPFVGESQEILDDALSPIYDQLTKHFYWKVMEYIPWIVKKSRAEVEGPTGPWAYKIVWNRRKGREVYPRVMDRGMKVHRSVRIRMLAQGMEGKKGKGKQYRPKIRCRVHKGDAEARRPTREEWLANDPGFFNWVD